MADFDADALRAATEQARAEQNAKTRNAGQPALDPDLDGLGANFVQRTQSAPPMRFAGTPYRGWVVWSKGHINGASVVALTEDGRWRLGETKHGVPDTITPVITGVKHELGRPDANAGLRAAIVEHLHWRRSPVWDRFASNADVRDADVHDRQLVADLHTLAARELGRLLVEDEKRAAVLASRPADETMDVAEATEQLIDALLSALADRGHPGADVDPEAAQGWWRRVPTPDRYQIGFGYAAERNVRGDPYRPLVSIYMTFWADLRFSPPHEPVVPAYGRREAVAALYRYALERNIKRRVPAALQNDPGWPSDIH